MLFWGKAGRWPKFLKSDDASVIDVVPSKPMYVESFFDYPILSRLAVRDMREMGAACVVKVVGRRLLGRPGHAICPESSEDKMSVIPSACHPSLNQRERRISELFVSIGPLSLIVKD